MSRHKHVAPEQKHDKREQPGLMFSFQLSLSGIIGIGVVLLCLFFWMFLLGIWAGQTILYPPQPQSIAAPPSIKSEAISRPAEIVKPQPEIVKHPPEPEQLPEAEGVLLLPGERKRRIAPLEPPNSAATE